LERDILDLAHYGLEKPFLAKAATVEESQKLYVPDGVRLSVGYNRFERSVRFLPVLWPRSEEDGGLVQVLGLEGRPVAVRAPEILCAPQGHVALISRKTVFRRDAFDGAKEEVVAA